MLLLLRSPATGGPGGRGHLNTLHRVRRRRGSAVPASLSHVALPMPPERPRISVLLRSDGETLRISEDHGETIDATRCWAQRPLARGRYARALWKGLAARGVLPGRACRRLLLAPRMHASVLLILCVVSGTLPAFRTLRLLLSPYDIMIIPR